LLAVEGARERVFCVPGALEIEVVGSELPASTAQRWRAAGRHRSQAGRAGTRLVCIICYFMRRLVAPRLGPIR